MAGTGIIVSNAYEKRRMFVNLALIGMGSVGLLFAARLLSSVSFPLITVTHRREQATSLAQQGIRVRQTDGTEKCVPCAAVSLEEWSGTADWALIFVKQPQLPDLLCHLLVKPSHPSRFLLFQNGLGHLEMVKEYFPDSPVYAAVTTEGAMRLDDTTVLHTGTGVTWIGPVYAAGERNDPVGREQLEQLAAMLRSNGMDVQTTSHIQERMWEKWVINCVVNPLTGILSVRNGVIGKIPDLRELAWDVVNEAVQVAQACGVDLDGEKLYGQVLHVCDRTAANRSSMLQDLSHRRETEIEALNGLLVRLADRRKVDVPVNRVLYRLLKTVEALAVNQLD